MISEVANGTSEDIDIAIKAAKACLHSPGWGYESTGTHRAQILRNLGQIILLRKDEPAKSLGYPTRSFNILFRLAQTRCFNIEQKTYCPRDYKLATM